MVLTIRDKLIIETLKNQDFCFYKDIENDFFSSKYSAYKRLNELKKHGYILIEPFKFLYLQKNLDNSCLNFIGMNRKYICLDEKDKILRRKISKWKIRHQLLLFSLKDGLEKLLNVTAIFENQVKDLKHTLYDRTFGPLPDFYLKGKDYKLAIELELHLKSKSRYSLKMSEYRKSNYSHVLYVVTHAKKITRLVRAFRYYRYVGIVHYAKPEDVISYWYGNIPLSEWLKKRTK